MKECSPQAITRRSFLAKTALASSALMLPDLARPASHARPRPNILYLMTDQQTQGAYERALTEHLERSLHVFKSGKPEIERTGFKQRVEEMGRN